MLIYQRLYNIKMSFFFISEIDSVETTNGVADSNFLSCNKLMTTTIKFFFALVSLLFLTHCGSKQDSSEVAARFSSIYTRVLNQNCVQCHEPQGSATVNNSTLIDFSSQALAYQTLTTLTSTGLSANINNQCSGVPLVTVGYPEGSYLLATLFSDYHHTDFVKSGCTPYPSNIHGVTLSTSEKQAIVEWVRSGAVNN